MTLLFTCTLLLSASLIFTVQPMFAKMVLPRLGGTPAVWNTCVVFFQLALLTGYAYTHATVRWLGVRRQSRLHLLVVTLPIFFLPIAIGSQWQPPSTSDPVYWLLLVLTSVVGLPFLAVSTSAPLLQRWFAETNHPGARDPFFLYAASNVGSLVALVAYPIAIEPYFSLQMQGRLWAFGYVTFVICVAVCAWVTWRSSATADVPDRLPDISNVSDAPTVSWRMRGLWLVLAAVPSSLMLSVTTYVSTDIAAVPLMWVVPLALYLLTFVFAFARRPFRFSWTRTLLPLMIVSSATTSVMRNSPPLAAIPLHFATFVVIALACHGRLARSRPHPDQLTEFYLWVAIGGAVGGLFNTLVAPLVFVTTAEYPLGLVLACWLCLASEGPPAGAPRRAVVIDIIAAVAVGGLTWGLLNLADLRDPGGPEWIAFGRTFAIPFALTLACWRRAPRFALVFGAVLFGNDGHTRATFPVLHAERTFFGQHQISDRGDFRYLYNGTTNHGSQSHDVDLQCEPTTYYTRTGPIGQLFGSFVGADARQSIGIIGLGTGSMGAYAEPGQHWTFFEINPAVAAFAEGRYFTFLTRCVDDYQIQIGDARRRLGEAGNGTFDVLVLDAFSSDAIPIHLMTREALELYLTKLSPRGVLAFHISNRYLELAPVLGSLASGLGLVAFDQFDGAMSAAQRRVTKFPSRWVVMARAASDLGGVASDSRWTRLPAGDSTLAWTDDFSNVFRTVRWGW